MAYACEPVKMFISCWIRQSGIGSGHQFFMMMLSKCIVTNENQVILHLPGLVNINGYPIAMNTFIQSPWRSQRICFQSDGRKKHHGEIFAKSHWHPTRVRRSIQKGWRCLCLHWYWVLQTNKLPGKGTACHRFKAGDVGKMDNQSPPATSRWKWSIATTSAAIGEFWWRWK